MLSGWPIRRKLVLGITIQMVIVATLMASAIYTVDAYKRLVKSISGRADELPLANELSRSVSEMRIALSAARAYNFNHSAEIRNLVDPESTAFERFLSAREEFLQHSRNADRALEKYRKQLEKNVATESRLEITGEEWTTLRRLEDSLRQIKQLIDQQTVLDDTKSELLEEELVNTEHLAAELPGYLHASLHKISSEVRGRYRWLLGLTWTTGTASVVLLILWVRLFYVWVFRPVRILVKGSRRVAAGEFEHRIKLQTNDEMAELAGAMNEMTNRFRVIRDDLDQQVKTRTQQVVRGEQLASVGFLAAGVAHEINNPLASIAMCAESLESRCDEFLQEGNPDHFVVRQYLRMIQTEAFRCKDITEKLLDFSRIGHVKRQLTDLRELVADVQEMVKHLGKYQNMTILLAPGEPLLAEVNPQEIKQVVLNLITNALDSLDAGGVVQLELTTDGRQAKLLVKDNGCGMTEDVLRNVFEPFFTRRRGGQGTGLGLSITYRIISDHGGAIAASSNGPGQGSQFVVTLPVAAETKENRHQYQAA